MGSRERLFGLRELCVFPSARCAFVQNGGRVLFASASERALLLLSLELKGDAGTAPLSHLVSWDSGAATSLSFDSSGSWVACAVGAPKPRLRLVPALFLLEGRVDDEEPHSLAVRPERETRDYALPLETGRSPTALIWWETCDSRSIIIVGDQTGGLLFFSLDTLQVIGKSYIVGRVCELDIYVDDKEEAVDLLITSSKNRQWRLTIEEKKRMRVGNSGNDKKKQSKSKDPSKRDDNIMSSVFEMLDPKIQSFFSLQSTSNSSDKRNNPTPICLLTSCIDDRKPEAEETTSKISTTQLIVSPQSYAGDSYVSILNSTSGSFTLHHNIENREPVAAYKMEDLSADAYKILWQKTVMYAFGLNTLKIHSGNFALQQNNNRHTVIWEDSLEEGEFIVNAWIIDKSRVTSPTRDPKSWCLALDASELDLPRFNISPCIIATNKKIYMLSTNHDPCEWLVNQLIEGYGGTERLAVALDIRFHDIVIAAADILLVKRNLQRALPMYRMAKLPSDEILMRLGSLGLYKDMLINDIHPQSNAVANVCFFAHVLSTIIDKRHMNTLLNFIKSDNNFDEFMCMTLCADLGFWEAIEVVSFQKGLVWLGFEILVCRLTLPCRGVVTTLLNKFYAPYIVQESGLPLLKFIDQYCESFDTLLLKKLCVWMCPLQDCFRILIRALCTSQPNTHLSGMRRLIRTFFGVVSVLHSRLFYDKQLILSSNIKKNNGKSCGNSESKSNISGENELKTTVSCGNSHWGVVSRGKICLMRSTGSNETIDVDLDYTGKAIAVSCGREHTLILTENGVYSFGDNRFGQLGVGSDINVLIDVDHPILVGVMKKSSCNNNIKEGFAWYNEKVIQISAGQYHSACVTDRGILYTWGWGVHGQLGHGTIYNEMFPKKVSSLLKEKILYVGCGSCHTAILSASGQVYLCGNSAFGQIGDSTRQKCNTPLRIDLGPSPIIMISVGYFHTLALNKNNEIWTWGSSPQKLRLGARNSKRALLAASASNESQDDSSIQSHSPTAPDDDYHLYPTKVDTSNVNGKITAISAGWHHSCLVDHFGTLYVWGLNLDCQLGTGDRNEVFIPTAVEVNKVKCDQDQKSKKADSPPNGTKFTPNAACGGDYTVFVKPDGNVFITGNSFLQETLSSKSELRVVMFKNTKRIVRLPKPHANLQKSFRYVPSMSNFLHHSKANNVKYTFEWPENPLVSYKSFENPMWANSILQSLYMFIDDDTPLMDTQLRALLACLRGDYTEALNLQLNTLFCEKQEKTVNTYLQHTNVRVDAFPIDTIQILQDKIIQMSRAWKSPNYSASNNLNSLDLNCQCKESKYVESNGDHPIEATQKDDITVRAVSVMKGLLDVLPDNCKIWTDCINEATTFWIDHELDIDELENVLLKTMSERQAINMSSAIFCSKETIDYQKHLSSTFNLELCDKILQSWS